MTTKIVVSTPNDKRVNVEVYDEGQEEPRTTNTVEPDSEETFYIYGGQYLCVEEVVEGEEEDEGEVAAEAQAIAEEAAE